MRGGLCAGRWTREEHQAFLRGLAAHGREWKRVAALVCARAQCVLCALTLCAVFAYALFLCRVRLFMTAACVRVAARARALCAMFFVRYMLCCVRLLMPAACVRVGVVVRARRVRMVVSGCHDDHTGNAYGGE